MMTGLLPLEPIVLVVGGEVQKFEPDSTFQSY